MHSYFQQMVLTFILKIWIFWTLLLNTILNKFISCFHFRGFLGWSGSRGPVNLTACLSFLIFVCFLSDFCGDFLGRNSGCSLCRRDRNCLVCPCLPSYCYLAFFETLTPCSNHLLQLFHSICWFKSFFWPLSGLREERPSGYDHQAGALNCLRRACPWSETAWWRSVLREWVQAGFLQWRQRWFHLNLCLWSLAAVFKSHQMQQLHK